MILYSIKTFFKTDKARKGGLGRGKHILWKGKCEDPLMKRCVSVKMTILKEAVGKERDSSPDIFIRWNLVSVDWRAVGKIGVCRRGGRPWVCVCGIYILTLIVFYCADASPSFLLFSVVLSLCSCTCQVPNWPSPPPQGAGHHPNSLCSGDEDLSGGVISFPLWCENCNGKKMLINFSKLTAWGRILNNNNKKPWIELIKLFQNSKDHCWLL